MQIRSLAALCSAAVLLAAPVAFAQAVPEVPAPSPAAKVSQRVGITDFTVEYSSPAVKGRPIWGALVPFDQVWRTGANASTKLVASTDFTVAGKPVKAGTYGLYTIPGKDQWTVIVNANPAPNGTMYDEKADVLRVTVKPEALPVARERLTFLFADTAEDGTNLDLEWEKLRVRIPLKVDTKALVAGSVDKSLGEAWRPHFVAARYLLDSGGDLNKALEYANTSIAVKPHWWNNFVKAQILAKQGKKAEAKKAVEQAEKLGPGDAAYENFGKGMVSGFANGLK